MLAVYSPKPDSDPAAVARGVAETFRLTLRLMGSLGFAIQAFPDDPDFKLATKAL